MQCFRHKVTWRQLLNWAWLCAKALISSQMSRYLQDKCVQWWVCLGMAGTALQSLSCLCVPHTLTHLCLPVLSELHSGFLLTSSSTPDNTGLIELSGWLSLTLRFLLQKQAAGKALVEIGLTMKRGVYLKTKNESAILKWKPQKRPRKQEKYIHLMMPQTV